MSARAADLPKTFRIAAGARRMLGARGTRALYRSPAVRPLRRLLAASAPATPQLVEVCGGPLRGARMYVDLSCEKYYWMGTHEEPVQRSLASHARPGGVAYDIGAHVGFFSLLLSRAVGIDGRVLSFEPHVANVERLRANVAANDLRNIDVRGVALGDVIGDERFSLHASSLEGSFDAAPASPRDLSSRRPFGRSPSERGEDRSASAERDNGMTKAQPRAQERVVSVAATTLDAIVSGGAPAPDLMKIDVEGAEGRVIRGGRETIAARRPVMVIEVHSREAWDELLDALPIPYDFTDIDCGRDASFREPGHYLALPTDKR